MKKIISLMTVAALLLSFCVTASASSIGVYAENFEGDVSIGGLLTANTVLSNPTGFVSVIDTADLQYKKAIQLKSDDEHQTDAAVRVSPEISSEKITVSFDIRPRQTNQGIRMLFNLGWLLGSIEGETSVYSLYLSNTGDIEYFETGTYDSMKSTGKTYIANEWIHVDMELSLADDKKVISYYINGELVGESKALAEGMLTSKLIKGLVFEMQTGEGQGDGSAKLDIDNVSVIDTENVGFSATASKADGYIDIFFSETVKDIDEVDVLSLEKVNGSESVSITSHEAIGYNKVRVYYSGTLSTNEEYRITLKDGITSVFGNALSNLSCYFYVEGSAETVLLEMDGDTKVPTPIVYLGANQDNPDATGAYASYQDKGGELGKVLEIKGDDTYEVNVGFALDNATTGKQIKLIYDLYACQQNQAFTQYTNRWITGWNENDNAPAYGMMLNHQTSFALSDNMHHCWSGTGTQKWPLYAGETKYTVEIIYDFAERTVTTDIKGVTAAYLPLSGTPWSSGRRQRLRHFSIKSVCFTVNNGNLPGTNVSTGANPGDAVFYIDNLKISDITPTPYVKSVRFEGCDGEEVTPDKEINPAVRKINIEFSSEVNVGELTSGLTLSDGVQNVGLEYEGKIGNTYTFKIEAGALEPEGEYTLNISGVTGAPGYIYEFETTEGEFTISLLEWERSGGTTTLNVRIVNTSGTDKSAVVSASAISGNKMTDFDMRIVDLSERLYFEDTITLTVAEGDAVSAYVFDSMERLNLLCGVAESK